MNDGIYIVGNDKYAEEVRALVNSIRHFDPEAPILLIPYDNQADGITRWLQRRHGIELFPFPEVYERITARMEAWFDFPGAPAQRNKVNRLRNLAAWFGPFDRFVSLDADIVVFEDIRRWCGLLEDCDLLACDDLYRHRMKWVFQDTITESLPGLSHRQVFNGGFWISRSSLFPTEGALFEALTDAGRDRRHFDFEHGALAQPILNYAVLSRTRRVRNLVQERDNIRVWVGDDGLESRDNRVFFRGVPCPYLHWAGRPIEPGKYFYDVWRHYHDLAEKAPVL